MSDYHRFFLLCEETPNMGDYIVNLIVDKMRLTTLKIICKAYAFLLP